MTSPSMAIDDPQGTAVIVLFMVKGTRSDSGTTRKRIRSAIRKQLRAHGIHVMHWGPVWFVIADHETTAREIEKKMVEYTLRSRHISSVTFGGNYGFGDFFNLKFRDLPFSPEFVIARVALKLATQVMRIADPSWPAYADLQYWLPRLLEPSSGKSRLNVEFGESHV